MNVLFVFVVLSASAVLSSPVPARRDDKVGTNPIDVYNDDFKKLFPELKFELHFPHPQPFSDDFFNKDAKEFFDSSHPAFPPPIWPNLFTADDFKNINHNFKDLKDLKNDTVENVKEVDGNIVHEKEVTYSNGDKNHHIAFRQKTISIRPKNEANKPDEAGKRVDAGQTYPAANRGVLYKVDRPTIAPGNPNNRNPDEDVEMISVSNTGSDQNLFA